MNMNQSSVTSMDYCKTTNFPDAVPFELDGVALIADETFIFEGDIHPRFVLIHGVWSESFDLERLRRDESAQKDLDDEWSEIDRAKAGNKAAQELVAIRYGRYSGRKYPESREAKRSDLGLPQQNPITGETELRAVTFTKTATCKTCGCKMAVQDRRHRYCSPACESSAKSARIRKNNDKRARVTHADSSCLHCKEPFTPKRTDSKYCSVRCRVAAHRSKK